MLEPFRGHGNVDHFFPLNFNMLFPVYLSQLPCKPLASKVQTDSHLWLQAVKWRKSKRNRNFLLIYFFVILNQNRMFCSDWTQCDLSFPHYLKNLEAKLLPNCLAVFKLC